MDGNNTFTPSQNLPYKPLHLVLNSHWYNAITQLDKDEEYRAYTAYYRRRLCHYGDISGQYVIFKQWTHLVIHKGYTSITTQYPIKELKVDYGKSMWGAPTDKKVFVIKVDKSQTRA